MVVRKSNSYLPLITLALIVLLLLGSGHHRLRALSPTAPALSVTPHTGIAAGEVILTGSGYTPGGYEGTIRWDGTDVDTLFIAAGGIFTTTFNIPADAGPGPHTITVCAGSPCFTGEFEQTVENPKRLIVEFTQRLGRQAPHQRDRGGL